MYAENGGVLQVVPGCCSGVAVAASTIVIVIVQFLTLPEVLRYHLNVPSGRYSLNKTGVT